mmetsp:Transcript_4674/g.9752  ORF Transcript_4674/g.9752 Transcript_4674/m.9752 type:complete len:771 (+) Transcript_4674:354-2666(+)
MQDLHQSVGDGEGSSVTSSSTQGTYYDDGDGSPPISSPSVVATPEEDYMPSSSRSNEEDSQQVDISNYYNDMSTTTQDDHVTSKSTSPWQQLNQSMRSEILSEGKSPTWREEWFGVHLPPSAVARGAPTIEEEEEVHESSSLPNPEEEEEESTMELDQEEHDDSSETDMRVEEPPPPPPPPKQSLPIVTTPPVVDDNAQSPPSPFSLSSLLSSPGPSIPLYPLLLLLTTIYILKQTLHCLFGFKSRTRVTRSMTRVLLNKKQFVIPKDQLLQHIEWMKLRSDLRRMREKNKKMQGVKSGGLDNGDAGIGGRRGDGGGGSGGGSGSSGTNGNSGDHSSNSGGSGEGHQGNANNDDRADNSDNANYGNGSGQKYSNHNNNNLGLSEKERFHQWMVNQEKLQHSTENIEQLNSDYVCTNGEITMLKEFPKSLKDLDQLKNDDISATEKILMLKELLAEVLDKKDEEIAMLKSEIEANEQANIESNEKASIFETQCKEMQEEVASLKEEVAVLELVCERMYSSGDGEDELEGLEIEGENCLRSCLGSLTNMNEEDDESMASTDSEWDRMEEENKILRTENELLQESLDCLRKELDEARTDAANLSQELNNAKTQRDFPSMNDLTMEMTDESFECNSSNSIPLFVEGTESVTDTPQPSPPSGAEVSKTIRLLVNKYAQGTRQVVFKESDNPNQDLNQDLLDLLLLMADLRKLDGYHTKENVQANSARKRSRTRDHDTRGRGRSRHRRGAKERSRILTKSRLTRIREKSLSRRDSR